MQGARVFDKPTQDTDGVGDVGPRCDSKVKELTDKLPVGDIGHIAFLIRAVQAHRFRESGAILHRCRYRITVSHLEVFKYRTNISWLGEADGTRRPIALDFYTEEGLDWALVMQLEVCCEIGLHLENRPLGAQREE